MKIQACSICGKPTVTGGLCSKCGAVMYNITELKKWELEDEEQFQDKHKD